MVQLNTVVSPTGTRRLTRLSGRDHFPPDSMAGIVPSPSRACSLLKISSAFANPSTNPNRNKIRRALNLGGCGARCPDWAPGNFLTVVSLANALLELDDSLDLVLGQFVVLGEALDQFLGRRSLIDEGVVG